MFIDQSMGFLGKLDKIMQLSKLTILEILEKVVEDHDDFVNDSNLESTTKDAFRELISPVRTLAYWITKELQEEI